MATDRAEHGVLHGGIAWELHVELHVAIEQAWNRAERDDLAGLHHRDVIRESLEVNELVRGNEDGALIAPHELQQLREELLARKRIEAGRRLIEDQQLRIARQRQQRGKLHARAERQRVDALASMNVEVQLQALAPLRVPVRIKAAHEVDGATDRVPGPIAQVGAHVGRAPFDFDFVRADIVAQ